MLPRALATFALAAGAWAAAAADPVFEAAVVKVIAKTPLRLIAGAEIAAPFQGWRYTPGRVTCRLLLRDFIQEAYELKSWQISGPAFLDGDYYDLQAVMPETTTHDRARLMLRSLLKERFDLRFHMESKIMPVYALTIDKHGFKLKPMAERPGRVTHTSGFGRYAGSGISMAALAQSLSGRCDRPVVDDTGVDGVFEFDFRWTPDGDTPRDDSKLLDAGFFAAMRNDAGLRLEARQLTQDIMVVEHLEKAPEEN